MAGGEPEKGDKGKQYFLCERCRTRQISNDTRKCAHIVCDARTELGDHHAGV